jgi:hypothetical protein
MRTTLNLQDDAFRAASDYAAARAIKLGDAVSELVQRGLGQTAASTVRIKNAHGLAIFDVKSDGKRKKATAKLVKQLMDD